MKPQLHATSVATFSRCGEQFRRRYIGGERMPPGIAAHVGSGVDLAVTANLAQKIQDGTLLSAEAVKDLARDGFQAALQRDGAMLSEEEIERGEDVVAGEAYGVRPRGHGGRGPPRPRAHTRQTQPDP